MKNQKKRRKKYNKIINIFLKKLSLIYNPMCKCFLIGENEPFFNIFAWLICILAENGKFKPQALKWLIIPQKMPYGRPWAIE
jgi:hypothetical protein